VGRPLLVNVAELLREPGTQRGVRAEVVADELELDDPRLDAERAVDVDLTLESLTDTVLVVGTVRVPWRGECRRCLTPVAGTTEIVVDERYQRQVTDPDAFPIRGEQLDVTPMIREQVLLELDAPRLCRDDCAGLCPVCGIDRNTASCDCDTSVRDERWSLLDTLRGDLGGEDAD
jgi:uncharacterized protein